MESNKASFRSSCRFLWNLGWEKKKERERFVVKTEMFLSIKAERMPSSDIFLEILLMEEILQQLRLVVHLILHKVLYIPGGAGFLPSTVCCSIFLRTPGSIPNGLCWMFIKCFSFTSCSWLRMSMNDVLFFIGVPHLIDVFFARELCLIRSWWKDCIIGVQAFRRSFMSWPYHESSHMLFLPCLRELKKWPLRGRISVWFFWRFTHRKTISGKPGKRKESDFVSRIRH